MAADTTHPAFPQPTNQHHRIWRYLDFAKFVVLLQTGCLYFPRVDTLEDPFEGSLSKAEYEHWQAVAAQGEADSSSLPPEWRGRYFNILMGNARDTRRSSYVSCWYAGEGESEAMWRLYDASGYTVAIQSTYQRLVNVLPADLHRGSFVGMVRYLDHHSDPMPDGNAFHAILHKRSAFEHEREIRAVIWRGFDGVDCEAQLAAYPTGETVPIVVPDLVERVYVSPLAPPWFANAVRGVTAAYQLHVPVEQSRLSWAPYL